MKASYPSIHDLVASDRCVLAATPEPQTPIISQQAHAVPEFSPLVVNIAYSLRNPVDGFEFVLPTESYPYVSFESYYILLSDIRKARSACVYDAFCSGLS